MRLALPRRAFGEAAPPVCSECGVNLVQHSFFLAVISRREMEGLQPAHASGPGDLPRRRCVQMRPSGGKLPVGRRKRGLDEKCVATSVT
jgi:hypothetical protein